MCLHRAVILRCNCKFQGALERTQSMLSRISRMLPQCSFSILNALYRESKFCDRVIRLEILKDPVMPGMSVTLLCMLSSRVPFNQGYCGETDQYMSLQLLMDSDQNLPNLAKPESHAPGGSVLLMKVFFLWSIALRSLTLRFPVCDSWLLACCLSCPEHASYHSGALRLRALAAKCSELAQLGSVPCSQVLVRTRILDPQ